MSQKIIVISSQNRAISVAIGFNIDYLQANFCFNHTVLQRCPFGSLYFVEFPHSISAKPIKLVP